MGLGHSKVTLKSTQALLLFHQSKRSLDQFRDVLAPSDFFPCRTSIDQAIDFGANIEQNFDVTRSRPTSAVS
jgi:hypothetical protein